MWQWINIHCSLCSALVSLYLLTCYYLLCSNYTQNTLKNSKLHQSVSSEHSWMIKWWNYIQVHIIAQCIYAIWTNIGNFDSSKADICNPATKSDQIRQRSKRPQYFFVIMSESLKIIHRGLLNGWGVSGFHIVESLVFSAHITKWDCHPAMTPACFLWQAWRTCCWGHPKQRKVVSLSGDVTSFTNKRRTKSRMAGQKCGSSAKIILLHFFSQSKQHILQFVFLKARK